MTTAEELVWCHLRVLKVASCENSAIERETERSVLLVHIFWGTTTNGDHTDYKIRSWLIRFFNIFAPHKPSYTVCCCYDALFSVILA